jgi:hypothetical protein
MLLVFLSQNTILIGVRVPDSAQANEETDIRFSLSNPSRHLALNSLDTERVVTHKNVLCSVLCEVARSMEPKYIYIYIYIYIYMYVCICI